jgi:(E)-4-hydroxy-3-methylbut-2-enyl-diphosphate synthase
MLFCWIFTILERIELMSMTKRRKTNIVRIGNIFIGGDNPIAVQTMTNTTTSDVKATLEQIVAAKNVGADIVRVTVNDDAAADAMRELVALSPVPLVADIHFNYRFALKAIDAGIAKVRINPGNIGNEERIKAVLDAANEHNIPIRIGVNSGSLEKDILKKYGSPTAEALVESAMRNVEIANKFNFDNLVIAVKSSSVQTTIDAYRLLSERTNYPLHLGVTESGTAFAGAIKSSVALGILLSSGIGDTIRVSLTDNPMKEVSAGIEILAALGLRNKKLELISCPTCGRTEVDVIAIVNRIETELQDITPNLKKNITVAIMGCVVNGPGEAQNTDIAICCGKSESILFLNGEKAKHIANDDVIHTIVTCVKQYT